MSHRLHLISQAQDKESVARIIQQVFYLRHESSRQFLVLSVAEELDISKVESEELCASLLSIIRRFIYEATENSEVLDLFPADLEDGPKKLIARILVFNREEWRRECVETSASVVPRLSDFDWSVNLKTASNLSERMSVPSVILNLQIDQPPDANHTLPHTSQVAVELNRAKLATMLEGLRHIRDTLANVSS